MKALKGNETSKQVKNITVHKIKRTQYSKTLQGGPKIWDNFLYALNLSNINRFAKLFHCQNQKKICNNTITKTPPHLECVATVPCEMSSVLNANENKMTSVTTHFKKLTTGNVFSVSVIV